MIDRVTHAATPTSSRSPVVGAFRSTVGRLGLLFWLGGLLFVGLLLPIQAVAASNRLAAAGEALGPQPAYPISPTPVCKNIAVHSDKNRAVTIQLQCSDSAKASLTYTIVSGPADGTLGAIATGGRVGYTPAKAYAGTDRFTYTASSSGGTAATATVAITVLGPPHAQITAPATGGTLTLGQPVTTRFVCTDVSGGPGIKSCTDSNGATGAPAAGSRSSGSGLLRTSKVGKHTYKVTAVSKDGETSSTTLSYTVAPLASSHQPVVTIRTPSEGRSYTRGQVVRADYACHAGTGGPGVASCRGSNANGSPIGTRRLGTHAFVVTATSADGQRVTRTVDYRVVAPANRITIVKLKLERDGTVLLRVRVPNAGRLVVATRAIDRRRAASGQLKLRRITRAVQRRRLLKLRIAPKAAVRRSISRRRQLLIRVTITFRPRDGAARTVTRQLERRFASG